MEVNMRVIVEGGGDNLYRICKIRKELVVEQVDVGFLSNTYKEIGKTYNLEDALSLVRTHSGKRIKETSDW